MIIPVTSLQGRRVWCSEAIASAPKIEWHGRHRAGYDNQEDKCERGKRSRAGNCVSGLMTILRCLVGSTSFNPSQRTIATPNFKKSISDIAIGCKGDQF